MRGAGDRAGPGGFNMDRGDLNKRGSQVRLMLSSTVSVSVSTAFSPKSTYLVIVF